MIERGAQLPDIDATDLRGRHGSLADLATTGMPILVFASARSPLCRELEEVFEDVARLDEGDYNVWAIIEGTSTSVARAFPRLSTRVRCFPVPTEWPGLAAFGIEAYPALVVADRSNAVLHALEGWDRDAWQEVVNSTRALLGWLPTVLSRELPLPAVVHAG